MKSASLKVTSPAFPAWPQFVGEEDKLNQHSMQAQLLDSLGLEIINHIPAIRNPGGTVKADVLVSAVSHELLQEINHACHL